MKKWWLQILVLKKTLESPLDCNKIKPVNPKGNQPWIFIGRTDAVAEAPILWLCDVMSQLTRNDPDTGKDLRPKEKGVAEYEMIGWHHWLNGREFEQTSGDSEEQGSLVSCSPWGCRFRRDWATEQQWKVIPGASKWDSGASCIAWFCQSGLELEWTWHREHLPIQLKEGKNRVGNKVNTKGFASVALIPTKSFRSNLS